jgi:hypothetical protein
MNINNEREELLQDNVFVVNNYEIIETETVQSLNVVFYYGRSYFDNEFYLIKRKRLNNYNEDISNME